MVHLHIHLDVRASCNDGLEQIAPLVLSPNSMRRGSAVRRTPLRRIRVSGGEGGTVSSSLSELGTVPGGVIGVGVKMGMLAGGNGLRCRCGEPGSRTEGW